MLDAPLLAADVWGWIVPVVVIAIYVISHLWNLIQGQQPQQQRPNQQRRPRGPQGERPLPGQPQQPAAAEQTHLNTEIEQFLKRANERREQKSRRATEHSEAPNGPIQRQPRPTMAVDVEQPVERTDFNSVSSSVERHLGMRSFDKREELLAEDIDQADEDMELHLQQTFGHRVGTFDTASSRDAEDPQRINLRPSPTDDHPAVALALAGLLVNHASLRQAVLLKEILERPVDRW